MMKQNNLFDFRAGQRLKKEGMAAAADHYSGNLETAREIARRIARSRGVVTADDVGRILKKYWNIDSLGPAAGSIFKGSEWQWTGEFRKSSRVTNHGRLLRVWRLNV